MRPGLPGPRPGVDVGAGRRRGRAGDGPGPGDSPRPEARPGSLARYVPKQDNLFFYLEFDGLDAHQAAWKNSAAYKLLNDTKLGALIEDLATPGRSGRSGSRPRPARRSSRPS